MIPSIYINLEDDVSKIVERLRKESASEVVLVCPKRCFLFNDSINLRLLKKQTELLKKTVSILTMDERGQMYAKEAGFTLRFLPKTPKVKSMSDIGSGIRPVKTTRSAEPTGSRLAASEAKKTTGKIAAETAKLLVKEPVVPLGLEEIKQTARKLSKAEAVLVESQSEPIKIGTMSAVPKVDVRENIFPEEIENRFKAEKAGFGLGKWVASFLFLAGVLLSVLFLVVLPKARVILIPKNDILVRDLEISYGTSVKTADPTKLVLPGTQVAEDLELKKTINSQGKKEVGNRATGFVKIYNFTRLPLNLKVENTTLSLNGKNYNLVNDVNQLKPTGYKNPRTKEVDESTLGEAVEIIAAEGGESYNLPAGTRLEISNKVLGSKPQLVYAKTDSPIDGGTSRYLSVVTDQDITGAQQQLKDEGLAQVRNKLQNQGLVLPDDSYNLQVVQFNTDKSVGTQSPNFEANIKLKLTGLAVQESELEKLVFDRINQTLSDNKTLDTNEGTYQLVYKTKQLDGNNQLGVLSVHFQGRVWYNLSETTSVMAKKLVNKTPVEANELLSKNNEIDRIDVILSPSWQKRLPFLSNNIQIKIQP